jgi:diguanylate cyclase (GGDEF)-like protein
MDLAHSSASKGEAAPAPAGAAASATGLLLDQALLDAVAHGICIYSADFHLIAFNRRLLEILKLDPGSVHRAMPMREFLRAAARSGNLDEACLDAICDERLALLARNERLEEKRLLPDGRTLAITFEPVGDGRWVTSYRDITAQTSLDAELRDQVARFGQALGNMSHGLAMYGPDERLTVCNARFVETFGLDPTVVKPGATLREVAYHACSIGTHGDVDPEAFYQSARVRLVDGTREGNRHRLGDGRIVVTQSRPMDQGGWVVTCEDITESERVAEELRQQHRRFGWALDNMYHGLAIYGPDERLIVCNATYVEMFAMDPDVVQPRASLREIIQHVADKGIYGHADMELLYADALVRLKADAEKPHIRRLADGRLIATRSRAVTSGGWIVTGEDVTESERTAEILREQHKRFDAALNNMSQALCMFDADHRLIVCNDRYVTMFSADREVVKPGITLRGVFEHGVSKGIYPGVTADELVERRIASLASGGRRAYDQRMANGRLIEVMLSPMADGGWVGTFDDVTELRRVEAERAAAIALLSEKNLLLDATLESMAHGLAVFDRDFNMVIRNQRYLDLYQLKAEAVPSGKPLREIIAECIEAGVHPGDSDADELFESFRRQLVDNTGAVLHRRLATGRIMAIRNHPMSNGDWVATFEDITERERAAEQLREQNQRFDAALNNMAHGLAMLDEDLNLIVCNKRYLDMYRLPADIVKPGASMRTIVEQSLAVGNYSGKTADELLALYKDNLRAGHFVTVKQLGDGRYFKVIYRAMPGGWVATHEDVTERHTAEQHIAYMAHHDALTGLPNRVLFLQTMEEGLVDVADGAEPMALFCLDLDHFKGVNDTLGHPVGDRLLRMVSERLTVAVGGAGTLARLGGDEFAILLRNTSQSAAQRLARRLVKLMGEPFVIDGHTINTGLSLGIAMAPTDSTTADHLMTCADLALYRAKADGRAMYRFFEADMSARIQARRELELDLRQALANGEFHLVYQPQVRAEDLALSGFEALVRWNHPVRGNVPPSEFIPIAEETGLIHSIGEWVLQAACDEAARWPAPIKIAVNLSPLQFKARGLAATVVSALAASGLSPRRLELEITEAVLLQNDEATIAILHDLRALGIRISMDDFGIGYSSLSYLRSFPFDKIKIDRSFIADIDRNTDNAAIIRAMANLGASLGIDTTAEGVETEEQLAMIRQYGCTEIQGYLISIPLPARDALAMIEKRAPGAKAA